MARISRKRAFLVAYSQLGNIRAAAFAAGIRRQRHYEWLDDPVYAQDFAAARAEATDRLEEEARRRAVDGVERPVHYKGERVDTVVEYSDRLLEMLLKGHLPEKYRERVSVINEDAVDAEIRRLNAELRSHERAGPATDKRGVSVPEGGEG